MTLNVNQLATILIDAGRNMGGTIWSQMQSYAVPELKKIAIQIAAIAENLEDYTVEGARALMDMQVKAAIGVIVAMTSLTLLAVQNAINQILSGVSDTVNEAVGIPLL